MTPSSLRTPLFGGSAHAMARRQDPVDSSTEAFFIPDSSPMISYSPSWSEGYARGSDGFDSTLHTARGRGTFSLNLTATSFTLLIPTSLNCTALVRLNDSEPIPACSTRGGAFGMRDLPLGVHHIQYDTGLALAPGVGVGVAVGAGANGTDGISGGPADAVFWGVEGTRPVLRGATNVTFDDTVLRIPGEGGGGGEGAAEGFRYGGAGGWRVGQRTGAGEAGGEGGGGGGGGGSRSNGTVSVTERAGAQVEFVGRGSAVYIYGGAGPEYGMASVELDGSLLETLNMTSSWGSHRKLLWFRTGLDPDLAHSVRMTSLTDRRISIDFVVLTTTHRASASSGGFISTLAGKLILFLLVPLVALLLLGGTALIYFKRRRHRGGAIKARGQLPDRRSVRNQDSQQTLRPYWLEEQDQDPNNEKDLELVYSPPFSGSGRTGGGRSPGVGIGTGMESDACSSRTDMAGELVASYDAARKRLSERSGSGELPRMSYVSRFSRGSAAGHGHGHGHDPAAGRLSPLPTSTSTRSRRSGAPSPLSTAAPTLSPTSPAPLLGPIGARSPSLAPGGRPASVGSWNTLLRPISGFLGRRSLLSPLHSAHTTGTTSGMSALSPGALSTIGSEDGGPTSASGLTYAEHAHARVEYAQWTRATRVRATPSVGVRVGVMHPALAGIDDGGGGSGAGIGTTGIVSAHASVHDYTDGMTDGGSSVGGSSWCARALPAGSGAGAGAGPAPGLGPDAVGGLPRIAEGNSPDDDGDDDGDGDEQRAGEGRWTLSSSLPITSPTHPAHKLSRTHPFAQAQADLHRAGVDVASTATATQRARGSAALSMAEGDCDGGDESESDTDGLSIMGAPPSMRDAQSTHTARTYGTYASRTDTPLFFPEHMDMLPLPDIPAAPSAYAYARTGTGTAGGSHYPVSGPTRQRARKNGSYPRPPLSVGLDNPRPPSPDTLLPRLDRRETDDDDGARLPTSPTPGSTPPASRVPSGRGPAPSNNESGARYQHESMGGLSDVMFSLDEPIRSALALRSAGTESGPRRSRSSLSVSARYSAPTTPGTATANKEPAAPELGRIGIGSAFAPSAYAYSASARNSVPFPFMTEEDEDKSHAYADGETGMAEDGGSIAPTRSSRSSRAGASARARRQSHSRHSRASSVPMSAARPDSEIIPFEPFMDDLTTAAAAAAAAQWQSVPSGPEVQVSGTETGIQARSAAREEAARGSVRGGRI